MIPKQAQLPSDWLLRFITATKYRRHRRIGALMIPLILFVGGKKWGEFSGIFDHLDWILSYLVLTGVFYINIHVLVIKLFYRGRVIRYLQALAGTIALAWLILYCLHEFFFESHRLLPKAYPKETIVSVIGITVFLTPLYLVSTFLKLLQRWVEDAHRIDELEKRALQSELKALRNQIQPHFLFNMLNTIVVVNNTEPQLASNIVIKLADFLRYLLYDSNSNEVNLLHEIRFIRDYLELEQLRRDNFTYEINYDFLTSINVKIPSHILLTLAENAAKHSVNPLQTSFVRLDLQVKANFIYIKCENSVPDRTSLFDTGGLGLNNMQRRLELLFADGFAYHSSKTNDRYIVNLSLPI